MQWTLMYQYEVYFILFIMKFSFLWYINHWKLTHKVFHNSKKKILNTQFSLAASVKVSLLNFYTSHFPLVRLGLCLIFKYIEWVFQWYFQNYNNIIITIIKDELKLCELSVSWNFFYQRIYFSFRRYKMLYPIEMKIIASNRKFY